MQVHTLYANPIVCEALNERPLQYQLNYKHNTASCEKVSQAKASAHYQRVTNKKHLQTGH